MSGDTPRASAAALAKAALRRLAQNQLEPTPENYARAYAEESGVPAMPSTDNRHAGATWAQLVERLARNLQRGGRQWTAARRRDSLQRVLDGSRSDADRLQQRLQSLMVAWESDQASDPAATGAEDPPLQPATPAAGDGMQWPLLVSALESTLRVALPLHEPRVAEIGQQLASLADAVAAEGARPEHVASISELCQQACRVLGQGHRQVEQLVLLCRELTAGMTELAEEDSWAQGQCMRLQDALSSDLSLRGLRSTALLLAETRQRQQQVHVDRRAARASLKQLLHDMLLGVAELGAHAGRFQQVTALHAQEIEQADSLEGLASVVQAMLEDTRTVQLAVAQSHERLQAGGTQATELEARVRQLEAELKRLSDEACTDVLTQVANRRGLAQAFEIESARCQREGGSALAVGLIDIDNFKKLNDTLGHAVGDVALQSLAAAVRERLRPVDHLARFGGEEFVVLMPGAPVEEASQALTRLQRSLSKALFLHEGREVFVTFSAGVTAWRPGEALQPALERADEGLYEAKRTGKNRTCVA